MYSGPQSFLDGHGHTQRNIEQYIEAKIKTKQNKKNIRYLSNRLEGNKFVMMRKKNIKTEMNTSLANSLNTFSFWYVLMICCNKTKIDGNVWIS